MDAKISDFLSLSVVSAADVLPIVSAATSRKVTVGVLTLNLPNIGNSGITKNKPVAATGVAIPLTGTVVTLPVSVPSYTLANGSDGQEITLVSLGVNQVLPVSSYVTSIAMGNGSSITLVYILSIAKWIPKSSYGCTVV